MRYIKIINRKYPYFECGRCKERIIEKPRYLWTGMITKDETYICRDCAYREAYGSKNSRKAKKEKLLDE